MGNKIYFLSKYAFLVFITLGALTMSGQTIVNGILKLDSITQKNSTSEILMTDASNYVFKKSTLDIVIPQSVLVLNQNENDGGLIANNYRNSGYIGEDVYSKGNSTFQYGTWTKYNNLSFEPASRAHHTAVWTGTRMIIWGGVNGSNVFDNGGVFNNTTNTWSTMSATNAPGQRIHHTAIWTGTRMIIWGGSTSFTTSTSTVLNTGAVYNPTNNTWTAMSTTNAPSARANHTAIWTGTEMIIWGGQKGDEIALNTGAKYNPTTNTWSAITMTNAPIKRSNHTAVWTGTDMIVWGGYENITVAPVSILNDGSKYNPATNTWTPIQTNNKLDVRYDHTAIWTGSKMIIWGGWSPYSRKSYFGSMYDAASNTWSNMAVDNGPFGVEQSKAFWTGNEMVVVGDYFTAGSKNFPIKKYNVNLNKWIDCNEINIHKGTWFCNGVWNGIELVLWGGVDYNNLYISGVSKYNPLQQGFGLNNDESLFGYKKVAGP